MHDKFMILRLADVEFEHVGNWGRLSEEFESILGAFEASSAMSDAEYFLGASEGVEGTVPILVFVAGREA